ncbi:GlxA family transcriptional regulator [Agrobacterium vitis]|uniref:Helix-turn-helix domain-containing protein n=1 Tax=Agrobacterium vitis TaxID=373 RepID=A0AAE5AVJ2_AGRVI|nr:GlxA family transcriptional regulator [Agrobacterium vitis]MCF1499292.1 GlxA family transcriptional regulator [Allorhizobium sp. Av2]MCM2439460.1 GlxA family transcriptional regulator [Agrobacterium vitis]MUZ57639.1 helix-turn-helix domain-containing protein [Agrobacterium vitis]
MTKTPPFSPNMSRTVEILAFPNVQILDVTGPLQVFACANELTKAKRLSPPYALKVVSLYGEPVVCSAGLPLITEHLPETHASLDTLIIPGGLGVDDVMAEANLVAWIHSRALASRRTASICTGAFLVAATGLFDHRRVATHWERCQDLAHRYPSITVEADPIFVKDGSMWSSAGVTAGIDLCLALVEEDLGRDLALAIARDLVVYLKRPGGQAQYSATLSFQRSHRFADLHDWMRKNLAGELSLNQLATHCGMSERSFSRRYVEETGTTPARAVEHLRIEAARILLSSTKLPVKSVAKRCGFQNEETLRCSFTRLLSTSPQDYRKSWNVD